MLAQSPTLSNEEIRERVSGLAAKLFRPNAAEVDRTETYPFGHAQALRDLGIAGMTMPSEYGGRAVGFEGVAIAVEEAAKACGISGRIVVDTNMGAIPAIMAYGTERQKRRTAELVLDAADKPAICFSEPTAGSDATNMATKAVRHGNGYVLNGVKHWITGAGISRLYLVLSQVYDGETHLGIGSFMIEAGHPGLRIGDRIAAMGLRGIPEGFLHFEDCHVSADALLVPPAGLRRGFGQVMQAYNSQRIGAAAVALGIAQGAYEEALAYVDKREQFGRAISEFQGVQWMLADMSVSLRASRLLIHDTARTSNPWPDVTAAAQAKVFTADAAIRITNDALQLHGAAGYGRDLPLERMARDARMFTIGGGTTQILRNMIASGILGRRLPQGRG